MNIHEQIAHWLADTRQSFSGIDRPLVTLCYAQSLDGSIAIRTGEPLSLSGAESSGLTHQLRSMHDGILVGIGTVLSDDPQLTVRHCVGENPQPIVLDSRLRMPANARLCQLSDKRCWVLTLGNEDVVINGVDITSFESNDEGRICLQQALRFLWERGIETLMVEGGAHVITAFMKAQLVDALVLTISPTFVGGYKAVSQLGLSGKSQLPKVSPMFTGRLGDDVIVWGNLQYCETSPPIF